MLTFQLNFVSEVYLMDLVLLSLEKYLQMEMCMIFQSIPILLINDKEQYKTMFSLIKQVFIVLLSFSESLATKCLFLNDESCMVRPTLIDLNPVELKYYAFMISLDKCCRSFPSLISKNMCSKRNKRHKC